MKILNKILLGTAFTVMALSTATGFATAKKETVVKADSETPAMTIAQVQSIVSDGVGASSKFINIVFGGTDWDNYFSTKGDTIIASQFNSTTTNYGTHVLVNGVTYNDHCASYGATPLTGEVFFNLWGTHGICIRYPRLEATEITLKAGLTIPSGAAIFDGGTGSYELKEDVTYKALINTTEEVYTTFVRENPAVESTGLKFAQIRTPGENTEKLVFLGLTNPNAYTGFAQNIHDNVREYMADLLQKTHVEFWDGTSQTLAELGDFDGNAATSYDSILRWGETAHAVHLDPSKIIGEQAKTIRAVTVDAGAEVWSYDGNTKFVFDKTYTATSVAGTQTAGGFDNYGSRSSFNPNKVLSNVVTKTNLGNIDVSIKTDGADHIGTNGLWVSYALDAVANTYAHYVVMFDLNTLGKILINGVRLSDLADFQVSSDVILRKWDRAMQGLFIGFNNSFDYRTNALEVTIEAGCELPGADCVYDAALNGGAISYYTAAETTTYKLLDNTNGYANKTLVDGLVTLLHMDETVEGQCNELYASAKAAYNALGAFEKHLFATDAEYTAAFARLAAWAAAHGEVLPTEGNISKTANAFASTSSSIVIAMACLTGLAISAFFFLRKRKEQN